MVSFAEEHSASNVAEGAQFQFEAHHGLDSPERLAQASIGSPRSSAWRWLGEHPDDAAELAALLHEAAPSLGLRGSYTSQRRSNTIIPAVAALSKRADLGLDDDLLRRCVHEAHAVPSGAGLVDWDSLVACLSSTQVACASARSGPSDASPSTPRGSSSLDVNSGGAVFFCMFDTGTLLPHAPPGRSQLLRGAEEEEAEVIAAAEEDAAPIPSAAALVTAVVDSLVEAASYCVPVRRDDDQGHAALGMGVSDMEAERKPGLWAARRSRSEPALGARLHAGAVGGGAESATYGCLVLKVPPTRLQCQSELFASELTRHIGVACPDVRILRNQSGSDEGQAMAHEWRLLLAAAERIAGACPELLSELQKTSCVLIQEFIPCFSLEKSPLVLSGEICQQLGRMLALDMLLGNADRLVCEALGWRGNAGNVLLARRGRWKGRLIAIDALVQRRPPNRLVSTEDAACERLAELVLNDSCIAGRVLADCTNALSVLAWPKRVADADGVCDGGISAQGLQTHADQNNGMRPRGSEKLVQSSGAQEGWTGQGKDDGPEGEEDDALAPLIFKFQQGFRQALQSMSGLKGLFEMMYDVVREWIDEFLADMEASFDFGTAATPPAPDADGVPGTPGVRPRGCSGPQRPNGAPGAFLGLESPSADVGFTTQRIRHINQEAQTNERVSRRVAHWRESFCGRGRELRAAVAEWQAKKVRARTESGPFSAKAAPDGAGRPPRPQAGPAPPDPGETLVTPSGRGSPRLTTGFLDGVRPVVDVYELKVRLEHTLQRLKVLQVACASAPPLHLLPDLYLSDAVGASSAHTLQHLGITHVLNATDDLPGPDPSLGATWIRCPLRDLEEENIAPFFETATAFIDAALAQHGRVLVHCHAGKSRSCSLILAWMMKSRGWTLRESLGHLRQRKPEIAPNAGYMAKLLCLEEDLFGKQTVKPKKPKPGLRVCPECGKKVGLSAKSVGVHVRRMHPDIDVADAVARSQDLGTEPSTSSSEMSGADLLWARARTC